MSHQYYKLEHDSSSFTILSSESIPLDDENITQFIIQKNDQLESIPSTSSSNIEFLNIKHEPELMLQSEVIEEEVQEVVEEEQAVYAYEITRNERGELECPVCNANFKIIANLERHIQIHAKKFVFEIPKGNNAPKVLDGPPKLALYPCDFCSEAFEYKRHLSRHILSSHRHLQSQLKCDKCSFKADNTSQLDEHKQRHEKDSELLKCKDCPALLKSEKNLRAHELMHINKCEKCKKIFKTKSLLKVHENKMHHENLIKKKI